MGIDMDNCVTESEMKHEILDHEPISVAKIARLLEAKLNRSSSVNTSNENKCGRSTKAVPICGRSKKLTNHLTKSKHSCQPAEICPGGAKADKHLEEHSCRNSHHAYVSQTEHKTTAESQKMRTELKLHKHKISQTKPLNGKQTTHFVDTRKQFQTLLKCISHEDKDNHIAEIEIEPWSIHDPHDYWECVMKQQVGEVKIITPLDPDSEIGHNCIRFVCMSDTHHRINERNIDDFLRRVPHGDVLLHTGDFTLLGDSLQEYKDFNSFLSHLSHKLKLVIAGNHETALDPRGYGVDIQLLRSQLGLPPWDGTHKAHLECISHLKAIISNARMLEDNMVEFCGIKIYGLPWVPEYGMCGFGLRRGYELLDKYNHIPAGIDILMSHGPALGFCDETRRGQHVGCATLLDSVRKRIKPKYVVHGHIHEAYGAQTDGTTTFINAAICDQHYKLRHNPIVFDYPLPQPYIREDFIGLNLADLCFT